MFYEILLFFLLLSTQSVAQHITKPVQKNDKWGWQDKYGKTIIPTAYDSIYWLTHVREDYIVAVNENEHQIFNIDGEALFNQTFEGVELFKRLNHDKVKRKYRPLLKVKKNGQWGLRTPDKIYLNDEYDEINRVRAWHIKTIAKTRLKRWMNLIKRRLRIGRSFNISNNIFLTEKKGQKILVNKGGEVIRKRVKKVTAYRSWSKPMLFIIQDQESNKWGVITETGQELLATKYQSIKQKDVFL